MKKVKFDFSRLRGRMIERFGSCAAFGDAAGLKSGGVSNRLNNKVRWTDAEIYTACELLGIPDADIVYYFFTPKFD